MHEPIDAFAVVTGFDTVHSAPCDVNTPPSADADAITSEFNAVVGGATVTVSVAGCCDEHPASTIVHAHTSAPIQFFIG